MIDEIRQAITTKFAALTAVENAYAYEKEQLGDLPAITLLTNLINPNVQSTGIRLDVEWQMYARVYVNLDDWETAQRQLDEVVFGMLGVWRDDPTLGGLVERFRIFDTGAPPEFSTPQQWLRKDLVAGVTIEHVPSP